MTDSILQKLPAAFVQWVERTGYTRVSKGEALVIANDGGELRYGIRVSDGRILLSRAERAEEPVVILSAVTLDPVVAYLVTVMGDDHRASQGLAPIRLPFRWDEPAPGFTASRDTSGWAELRRTGSDDVVVAMAGRDIVHSVISLSYVLDIDLAHALASYESPSGAPRLTRFVSRDR